MDGYFSAADFVVFSALMVVSTAIGSYFAYKDRKNNSTETYYYGNRKLSPFPVALSLSVSLISAITVIGFPVEAYLFGIVFLWFIPGVVIEATINAIYYIPLIHRLKLATIYEYLERRYNVLVRKLCAGVTLLQTLVFMGITVYVPALALEAVTPISLNWSIVVTSLICTFYTSVGGMKAVVWTDVLQAFIMIFGSLSLFIKTVFEAGGFGNMVEAVERGGRNNFFKFDADPRMRSSVLTMLVGMAVNSSTASCCGQIYVQRFLSCRSVRDAQKATLFRIVPVGIILLLAAVNGLAMYAYYEYCDPKKAGYITKYDQTTPRLAIEVFRDMPGMAGLFVSAAYSGTLSTVSSGVNALAAITTEDFIIPRWPKLSATKRTVSSKGFSIFYGLLVMLIAYLISFIGSTVFEIAISLMGIVGGPVLAVYTAGIFTPWCNSIGAIVGLIIGWAGSCWVSVSSVLYHAPPKFRQPLPVNTEGCNLTFAKSETTELWSETTIKTVEDDSFRPPLADTLYAMSPFLFGAFGLCVSFAAINLVSALTGFNQPKDADPDLFVPILDNKKVFPKSMIKFFRFGVPEKPTTSNKVEEGNATRDNGDDEIRPLKA